MKTRNWCVGALIVAVIALMLGMTRLGYAQPYKRAFASGAFAITFGATPAFIHNADGGHVEADVVNPQSPNALFGPEVCRLGVLFYDASGSVLQASELEVGPGETSVARLGDQNVPPIGNAPSPIRVTFQVLDKDGHGRVRPCLAIPSVQVVDGKQPRPILLVPVLTN